MKDYKDFGIDVPRGRTSGQIKTYCPECRDTRSNRQDKSLSVNLGEEVWNCHYCGFAGTLKEREQKPYFNPRPLSRQRPEYKKPKSVEAGPLSEKALAWFAGRGISRETIELMKITEGLEFMPQKGCKANTVQFNYFRDGDLVNVKFRTGDKCFKLVADAELLPYNIDGIKGTEEAIITEGEADTLSFIECGRLDTVSVPNGANANLSYLDDYLDDYFKDKKIIYIAADADTKGVILRDELVRRFGAARCRIIEYGEGCKDANEHLIKFGKQSLLDCLSNAKEVKLEGVFTVSDFEGQLDTVFEHGLQKGVTIGHENFDSLCSFETKRLLIVTGIPGSGKSEFIDEIAERLNMRYEWKFAYFSPENAPLSYHASKLIEKFVGKKFGKSTMKMGEYIHAKHHLENNFSFISPPDNFRLKTILEKAEELVRQKGIKGLIIDPYNRLESEQGGNKSETQYISEILDRLTNFAQIHDVLVILMAHPTKRPRNKDGEVEIPSLYDISGSANFYNKADFGIVVHRDYKKGCTEIHVQKVKFRHLGECGVCYFKYNINNGRYTPCPEAESDPKSRPETEWDNSNHLINRIKEAEKESARNAVLDFSENDDNPDPF